MIITKDPDAKLDYGFDWTDWLTSGEVISTSDWIIASGLTEISDSHSNTVTSVWVSGGTINTDYVITNHITTSMGREDDRSHTIKVRNR
jgi:hypothetical protein